MLFLWVLCPPLLRTGWSAARRPTGDRRRVSRAGAARACVPSAGSLGACATRFVQRYEDAEVLLELAARHISGRVPLRAEALVRQRAARALDETVRLRTAQFACRVLDAFDLRARFLAILFGPPRLLRFTTDRPKMWAE
jgi:hypothetical protein